MRIIAILLLVGVFVVLVLSTVSFANEQKTNVDAAAVSTLYLPLIYKNAPAIPPVPMQPTPTPITPSPTPCNTAIQALYNPSFETPLGSDWQILAGFPVRSTYVARTGLYSLWLGGYNYANDSVGQSASVPTWAESSAVYFSWLMYSSDSTVIPYDTLAVLVSDANSNLLARATVWNTNARGSWYTVRLPVNNIANYRGQRISVVIGALTDSSYLTTWYVDDVWLVFGCGSSIAGLDSYPPATNDNNHPLPQVPDTRPKE